MKYYYLIINSIFLFGCSDLIVDNPDTNLNMDDFNSSWQIAKNYYPFFELKNINWDSLYVEYKPEAEASKGDEIFDILYRMFSELKDGHIEIHTKGGFSVMTYEYPRNIDRKAFSSIVANRYFSRSFKLAGDNKLHYQKTDNNIGYVYISTFSEGDDIWYKDFDKILEYFNDCKGIVIDVRNNGGGNSKPYVYITARLIEEPVNFNFYSYRGMQNFIINPINKFNVKPAVVLINGASFSAAEHFPEIVRQSSNITLVGDTTGGGGGGTEIYKLSSGKRLKIPNSYFTRLDGIMVEWNGILPDIVVEQTETDILNGRDKQLEYAINFLK